MRSRANTWAGRSDGGRRVGLIQPPGCRSCRDGGTWDWVRLPGGGNPFRHEYDSFREWLPEFDRPAFEAEVLTFMRLAAQGQLTFGKKRMVDRLSNTRDVLEIRLNDWAGARPGKRKVRLYFTEPAERDGMLLALKFAWKAPGPMALEEQDAHAREAQARYDRWSTSLSEDSHVHPRRRMSL